MVMQVSLVHHFTHNLQLYDCARMQRLKKVYVKNNNFVSPKILLSENHNIHFSATYATQQRLSHRV